MNTPLTNPLSKHFRQPVIHIKLPSGGRYWFDDSLDMPITGELPVYPLSAKDEIMLKTPDALLNGSGVVQVIESCIPNIKNAWKMPSIDVDAVLIAIRIASYSNVMEMNVICPHCKVQQAVAIDLNNVSSEIDASVFESVFEINSLRVKFKPQAYFEVNKANLAKFEEQKITEIINNEELTDTEKAEKFTVRLNALIDLNLTGLADSTDYIQNEEGVKVNQTKFLKEFYNLSDRKTIMDIRSQHQTIIEKSKLTPAKCVCENEACGLPISVDMVFDYSSFFA